MIIAAFEVTLTFHAESLKDKRSVVKRVLARSKGEFNVSGAEVDELDNITGAVLGFCSVGTDKRYLEGQLQALENFIERLELAEIVDVHREFIHV
jgi:uncharacterized protein YlxP (DUF503 family)